MTDIHACILQTRTMNCHTDLSIHHTAHTLTINMPQLQVHHFNLIYLHAVFIQNIIRYAAKSIIKKL